MADGALISRRQMLGLGRRMLFQPGKGPTGDALVCIFLRGGADGLHLVAPYGDPQYYAQRPRLGVPRPDDARVPAVRRGRALDDFFALHPQLSPLEPIFRAGQLAVVHAVGSPDRTRSHFEAMETMERGVGDGSWAATGWLGRHLQTADSGPSPLRALAIGEVLPRSLEGALGAAAIRSLDEFRLAQPAGWSDGFRATLATLYDAETGPLADPGRETFRLLRALERLEPAGDPPAGSTATRSAGARPQSDFGRALRQAAQLVRAELGLEVACIDLGGWDSHIGQETVLDGLIRELGEGLAAFHADLGERIDRVTVVVMSEFGRRVRENGGLGTDHGRATCFFLMGGGIRGGRVIADWPGLHSDRLEGPGDLPVTLDYRDLLAEIVAVRLRNPRWQQVFPGYAARFRGVTRPVAA